MDLVNHYLQLVTDLYINDLGMFGAYLVVVFGSFIPPIPDAVFFAFATNTFGIVPGFIISYLGTLTGASLVYFLFYHLSNIKWLNETLNSDNQVSFYAKRFKHIHLTILSICLAIPFLPAFAIHIAAGLVKMNYRKFLVAIMIGKIFLVFFWAYVGQSLVDGITNPKGLIFLGVVVVVVYYISRYIGRKYKLEE